MTNAISNEEIIKFANIFLSETGVRKSTSSVTGMIFSLVTSALKSDSLENTFENLSFCYSPHSLSLFNPEKADYSNMFVISEEGNELDIVFDVERYEISQNSYDKLKSLLKEWEDDNFTPNEYEDYFNSAISIFFRTHNMIDDIRKNSSRTEWIIIDPYYIKQIIDDEGRQFIKIDNRREIVPTSGKIEEYFATLKQFYTFIGTMLVVSIISLFLLPPGFSIALFSIILPVIFGLVSTHYASNNGKIMNNTLLFGTPAIYILFYSVIGNSVSIPALVSCISFFTIATLTSPTFSREYSKSMKKYFE